ncbi:MAG: bifunctional nuclease family protein [Candidatus Hinthialibacter antarcticus]|nr:bifunctional nuclease family protein [Candidatus Hinthialibacter antarcticus]
MIEMDFYELRLDESGADQIIILKEKNGARMMPILIGYYEAQSIHLALNDIHIQRPLTHDLAVNLISTLGGTMIRVNITDLRDSTFYARIYFETSNGEVDVDSRPSDAIALAIRTQAPIFVSKDVLEQVARE